MDRVLRVGHSPDPDDAFMFYALAHGQVRVRDFRVEHVLEDIQALDTRFRRGKTGEFTLHHNVGSPCQANDYQPLETVLGPGVQKRITAAGGRPTSSDLSYFNLAWVVVLLHAPECVRQELLSQEDL